MKPSEEKFVKRWEEDREVGKLKYSITYGLAYSIIMISLLFLLNWWTEHNFKTDLGTDVWLRQLWAALVVIVLSFPFGLIMWSLSEKRYNQLMKKTVENERV